ncbi:MAG: hypothetical protein VYA53_00910 [Acidobacteriota bacterium]|nr:hypothetical protein [Acidobacteriota bacterium]
MNKVVVPESSSIQGSSKRPLWQKLLPWLTTIVCFAFLYTRVNSAAVSQGSTLVPYLAQVFEKVSWWRWLSMMVPYTLFFFVLDSLIIWKVINWFNVKVSYARILPVRASAFILSLVNEQVGKGAIAIYLNRRDGVPGWEVASSMIFVMVCEFYYLAFWATIGILIQWQDFPPVLRLIPWIGLGAGVFFVGFFLFFSGRIVPNSRLRQRALFHAFRQAKLWQYGAVIILRSPVMLSAVVVYTLSLRLFGVEVGFIEMMGYLPVILFGAVAPGPMRSVAIVLWVVLFPDRPAEMSAFGLVQHNFFIFFNASMGLLFLKKANRELLGS